MEAEVLEWAVVSVWAGAQALAEAGDSVRVLAEGWVIPIDYTPGCPAEGWAMERVTIRHRHPTIDPIIGEP